MGLTYTNNEEAKQYLQIMNINGYAPSIENIEKGTYKFWSWGHMYTKGKATGLSQEFINFVMSPTNTDVAKQLGFIPVQNLKGMM